MPEGITGNRRHLAGAGARLPNRLRFTRTAPGWVARPCFGFSVGIACSAIVTSVSALRQVPLRFGKYKAPPEPCAQAGPRIALSEL
jgi:hypothetical protein